MRSQTITAASNGQDWVAQPVDTTGWLAGTGASDKAAPVGRGAKNLFDIRVGPGATADEVQRLTEPVRRSRRRAGVRRSGRDGDRAVRRSVRTRQLRRVGVDAGRRVAQTDTEDVVIPEPLEAGIDGYRLGRWSRLTLTVIVVAAVVVVAVSLTAGSSARAMVDVTVTPGDTLWSIATAAAPDRDPRDVLEEIRQLNNLQGTTLPVGVVLRVPASTG